MVMIKAIIFDVGKVLIDDRLASHYIAHVVNKDVDEVWKQMKPLVQKYQVGKVSRKIFWKKLLRAFNVNEKIDYDKKLLEVYKNVKINKGSVAIAKRLKKKGYKLAILSNVVPDTLRLRKNFKFLNLFHHQFFSPEIKMRKPKKRAFLYATRKLKVKPSECVFIDDHAFITKAARKLGMKTITFKNSRQLEKELEKIGVL